jgi:haloalkane dehalogenase
MYLFVECWKARPEWLALTPEARGAYMAQLGQGIGELLKAGVEVISWSMNDQDTSNRSPFDYFAVWKFPNKEMVKGFEQIVEQSGWYNYFDQVNLSGAVSDPMASITQMVNL